MRSKKFDFFLIFPTYSLYSQARTVHTSAAPYSHSNTLVLTIVMVRVLENMLADSGVNTRKLEPRYWSLWRGGNKITRFHLTLGRKKVRQDTGASPGILDSVRQQGEGGPGFDPGFRHPK